MHQNCPQVSFIGAGPGDPELITLKGQRLIQEADLIIFAGSLVPKEILKAKPGARMEDSSKLTLEETHGLIKENVLQGGRVARVHTGDPALYGAIREQIHLLEKEGIAYQVVPGVTAGLAAAAKAGLSLTLPEKTQTVIFTRISGKTPVPEKERLRKLAEHRCSIALYLSGARLEQAAEELLAGGLSEDTLVLVASRLGWSGEQIFLTNISQMSQAVKDKNIHRQTVFLILPDQESEITFSRLYSPDFSHGYRQAWPGKKKDD